MIPASRRLFTAVVVHLRETTLLAVTRRTSLDIFCDPRAHVWPPVIPLGLGDCFVAAGVSGYKAFVYDPHDLSFDRKVWRDR